MSIKPGIYKHSKTGKQYKVHFTARHSESPDDEFVAYEAMYDNMTAKYWIRPAKMFEEVIELDGKKVPRFVFIKEN